MRSSDALTTVPAVANSTSGIALGNASTSGDNFAIAIGAEAKALHGCEIAIGYQAGTSTKVIGCWGIAIGANAKLDADRLGGISIGRNTCSLGNYSIAIGYGALQESRFDGQVTIGLESSTNGARSVSVGPQARSKADCNVTLGSSALTCATAAIAIGSSSCAMMADGIAIGDGACSTCTNAISIGATTQATRECNITIGNTSWTCGIGSIVIGSGSCSGTFNGGTQAVVIGNSIRGGDKVVAIGNNQNIDADRAIGIGVDSEEGGIQGINIGYNNDGNYFVFNKISLGSNLTTASSCSFNIGDCSTVCSSKCFSGSLGYLNTVNHSCSNVIGYNITTELDGTVHMNNVLALGQGASKIHSVGSTGGSVTIDWNNGNNQEITLTSSATLTFSNAISGGSYSLSVTQGGSGSYTITWPASVKWPGGSTPVLSTGPGLTDVASFIYNGTNFWSSIAYNFA
jgi:hypothetical protein